MFIEQLQKLCREKGTSPSAIAIEIGKSKSAVTRWKNGQIPSLADVLRIALLLKVEVTDLIDSTDIEAEKVDLYYEGYKDGVANIQKLDLCEAEKKPATISDDELNDEEREIISRYRKLSPDRKRFFADQVQVWSDNP